MKSAVDGMHPLLQAMMVGGVNPQYMKGAMAAKDPKLGQALVGQQKMQKELPPQKQEAQGPVQGEAQAQGGVQRDWSGFSQLGQMFAPPPPPGAPGGVGPRGTNPAFTELMLQALMTGQPSQGPGLAQLIGG